MSRRAFARMSCNDGAPADAGILDAGFGFWYVRFDFASLAGCFDTMGAIGNILRVLLG